MIDKDYILPFSFLLNDFIDSLCLVFETTFPTEFYILLVRIISFKDWVFLDDHVPRQVQILELVFEWRQSCNTDKEKILWFWGWVDVAIEVELSEDFGDVIGEQDFILSSSFSGVQVFLR